MAIGGVVLHQRFGGVGLLCRVPAVVGVAAAIECASGICGGSVAAMDILAGGGNGFVAGVELPATWAIGRVDVVSAIGGISLGSEQPQLVWHVGGWNNDGVSGDCETDSRIAGGICLLGVNFGSVGSKVAREMTWRRAAAVSGGVMTGAMLFLFVVPSLIVGPRKNIEYLQTWMHRVAATNDVGMINDFNAHSKRNQSLTNAVYRIGNLIGYEIGSAPSDDALDDLVTRNNATLMDNLTVSGVMLLVRAAFLVLMFAVGWRGAKRRSVDDCNGGGACLPGNAGDFAVVVGTLLRDLAAGGGALPGMALVAWPKPVSCRNGNYGLHVGVGSLRAIVVDGKNWASGNWHKRVVYDCLCDGDTVDVGQALGGGEQRWSSSNGRGRLLRLLRAGLSGPLMTQFAHHELQGRGVFANRGGEIVVDRRLLCRYGRKCRTCSNRPTIALRGRHRGVVRPSKPGHRSGLDLACTRG